MPRWLQQLPHSITERAAPNGPCCWAVPAAELERENLWFEPAGLPIKPAIQRESVQHGYIRHLMWHRHAGHIVKSNMSEPLTVFDCWTAPHTHDNNRVPAMLKFNRAC